MQENIASKTLNFLGQRCPEDPGLCVPMYSSAPWQLLTRNNMQKAECTNSQNKPLHWTLNEVKMLERQKPAVHEHSTPVTGDHARWHDQLPKQHFCTWRVSTVGRFSLLLIILSLFSWRSEECCVFPTSGRSEIPAHRRCGRLESEVARASFWNVNMLNTKLIFQKYVYMISISLFFR